MKKGTLFAVYGTLRKGQGNWKWALKDAEFLGTKQISGYKMYSLGGYPMITAGGQNDVITVDLFRQEDETLARQVDGMELGAGYKRSEVTIDGENFIIYTNGDDYYTPERLAARYQAVESGDWVSFKTPVAANASL